MVVLCAWGFRELTVQAGRYPHGALGSPTEGFGGPVDRDLGTSSPAERSIAPTSGAPRIPSSAVARSPRVHRLSRGAEPVPERLPLHSEQSEQAS